MKLLSLIVLLFTVLCGIVFGGDPSAGSDRRGIHNFYASFENLQKMREQECNKECSAFRPRIQLITTHPANDWCDCKDGSNKTLIFAPPDWIAPNSRARADGQLSPCTDEKVQKLIRCASLP